MTVTEAFEKYGANPDPLLIFAIIFILQNYLSVSDDQLDEAVTLAKQYA